MKLILDACCGGRSFWFDRTDSRAVFMDKRIAHHSIVSPSDGRKCSVDIKPNIKADFTAMPFRDNLFHMVIFDPPHMARLGSNAWFLKRYGRLEGDWRFHLQTGFMECFRVLKPMGSLIFKWSSVDFPITEILSLVKQKPLFGHKSGKKSNTHWVAFIK